MLLLTTTARERACLAFTKNNWPADWLIWWRFPESWGFPLVSAAFLVYPVHRRSLAYITAAVSSSSKFEQSDGIDGILVDRESVECEKLHALLGQLESRNCYRGNDTLRVRRLWSQLAMALCCLFLLLPLISSPVNFFFWKPCRSNRGPSRNSGWVHRNWEPFEEICMAQTTKLYHGRRFRKREHKALCMLTCVVTAQPLVRDDSSSGDMYKRQDLRKDANDGWFDYVCTVTRVSIQMRKRAKILKIISQKTD